MIPETITMKQAMERYKCDRKAISTAILAEVITAYRPGKWIQIDKESADQWYLSSLIIKKPTIGRPRRGAKR